MSINELLSVVLQQMYRGSYVVFQIAYYLQHWCTANISSDNTIPEDFIGLLDLTASCFRRFAPLLTKVKFLGHF